MEIVEQIRYQNLINEKIKAGNEQAFLDAILKKKSGKKNEKRKEAGKAKQ